MTSVSLSTDLEYFSLLQMSPSLNQSTDQQNGSSIRPESADALRRFILRIFPSSGIGTISNQINGLPVLNQLTDRRSLL